MKKLTIAFALLTTMMLATSCNRPEGTDVPGPQGATGATGQTGQTGATGPQGPAATPYPTPTPSPTPTAVSMAVANYDEYVQGNGANGGHQLQPGLECTLYAVPNLPATPCLSSGSISGCTQLSTTSGFSTVQSFVYEGALDQPNGAGTAGFNVLPTELQPLYPTNFELVCTGFVVIPDYKDHEFTVSSDDGALLYVNGSLVVNDDGEHAVSTVSGLWKAQNAQVFPFEVEYFQGPGNVALIVNMDGQLLPAANLYH
jgi:hypothetical protein